MRSHLCVWILSLLQYFNVVLLFQHRIRHRSWYSEPGFNIPVMISMNWHTNAITSLFPKSKGSTLDFYRQLAFRITFSLLGLYNACFLGTAVIRFQKKMEWDNAIITHDYSFCSHLSQFLGGGRASCLVFHKLSPVVMVLRLNFIIWLKVVETPAENNCVPKMMYQTQRTNNMDCNVWAKSWYAMIATEMRTSKIIITYWMMEMNTNFTAEEKQDEVHTLGL